MSRAQTVSRVILFGTVCAVACQRSEDAADLLPPAGYEEPHVPSPPAKPSVRFREGWYPWEANARGSWRWMGKRGEVDVKALATDARLTVVGWAPVDLLAEPPTLSVSINGHEIDRFVAPNRRFTKEYVVPSSLQQGHATAVVGFESSVTATAPGDPRALGFSLVSLTWSPET